jgi:hypothetical protein
LKNLHDNGSVHHSSLEYGELCKKCGKFVVFFVNFARYLRVLRVKFVVFFCLVLKREGKFLKFASKMAALARDPSSTLLNQALYNEWMKLEQSRPEGTFLRKVI